MRSELRLVGIGGKTGKSIWDFTPETFHFEKTIIKVGKVRVCISLKISDSIIKCSIDKHYPHGASYFCHPIPLPEDHPIWDDMPKVSSY